MLTAAAFQAGETILPRRSPEQPDVSVLMPVLRRCRSPHLERAVESILAQRGVAFELVLIDDGSGDDTFALLQQWHVRDPRVAVVRYPRHSGLLGLRLDDGLRHATGRFVGYQLDNVLLRPGALARLHGAAAAADADTVMVFGAAGRAVRPEDFSITARAADLALIGAQEVPPLTYASAPPMLLPASLHPRGLVAQIGGFDPRAILHDVTACDFWMRARQVGRFLRLDEILAVVIDEPASDPALSIAEFVPGIRDWRALAPRLAPGAVADVDLLAIDEPMQTVHRQLLCDAVLRRFVATRCRLEDIVGTTLNGVLLPGHRIELDVVGRAEGTPSAKIAFSGFAQLYPRHIALRFTTRAPVYPWTDPPRALVEFRTFLPLDEVARGRARARGDAVIYGMDDDLLSLARLVNDPAWQPEGEFTRNVRAKIGDADFVFVYSDPHRARIRALSPRIATLSTNSQSRLLTPAPSTRRPQRSYAILSHRVRGEEMDAFADEVLSFFEDRPDSTVLSVFSHPKDRQRYEGHFPGGNIEFLSALTFHEFYEFIHERGFDFIINIQNDDHAFHTAKSPRKFLDAVIAGAVLVTSDARIFAPVPDDVCIKVPTRPGAWREALERTLDIAEDTRRRMVEDAAAWARPRFATESQFFQFMATYTAGALHALLRSRERESGRARIVIAEAADRAEALAPLLEAFGFEVVAAPPAAPGRLMDEIVAGADLVHADAPASPWVEAAAARGLPTVAGLPAATDHACAGLALGVEGPDGLIAETPRRWTDAARLAPGLGLHLLPSPQALPLDPPPHRPAAERLRFALACAPQDREFGAALLADALLGETLRQALAGTARVELALPFTAAELDAWKRRWPLLSDLALVPLEGDDADVIVVCGETVESFRAVLGALHARIPVIAVGSRDAAAILVHGHNGFLVPRRDSTLLAPVLRQAASLSTEQRQAITDQGRATAFAYCGDMQVAARLLDAYVLAARARWHRAASTAPRQAAPARRRRIALTLPPGPQLLLLGFRSSDPDGVRIRAARFSPGWRATPHPGQPPGVQARSSAAEVARFEVEAQCLVMGLRAGPGGAHISLDVDGVRRDIFVKGVVWYDIGQHVQATTGAPAPAA